MNSQKSVESRSLKMAVNAKHLASLSLITTRCRQCLLIGSQPSRHFSSTPSAKVLQLMRTPKDLMQRMTADKKSRKVKMKGVSGSQIPDDLGIISQTFIRPPNSEMPRLFGSTWKTRLKLEWLWAKTRVQNFSSYVCSTSLPSDHLLKEDCPVFYISFGTCNAEGV